MYRAAFATYSKIHLAQPAFCSRVHGKPVYLCPCPLHRQTASTTALCTLPPPYPACHARIWRCKTRCRAAMRNATFAIAATMQQRLACCISQPCTAAAGTPATKRSAPAPHKARRTLPLPRSKLPRHPLRWYRTATMAAIPQRHETASATSPYTLPPVRTYAKRKIFAGWPAA
ncbi:hypothetical protein NPIL_400721 [Nephila pilipes]|uniref:Uncharacterized protein n=1 Tax=Nephila pilipes TaxID=299642 RepID=A0A8X6NRI5_NEPPI|nr:hypothetical protein NPIL_400721 [Nephila pilipes]